MTALELHEVARRIARKCRWIIQSCLREEEWRDADQEFYRVIHEELNCLIRGDNCRAGKNEEIDSGG